MTPNERFQSKYPLEDIKKAFKAMLNERHHKITFEDKLIITNALAYLDMYEWYATEFDKRVFGSCDPSEDSVPEVPKKKSYA